MSEEIKQEQQKGDSKAFSTMIKVIIGLVFLALGIAAIIVWWQDLLAVIRGCVGLFLILAGAITLAIAKE